MSIISGLMGKIGGQAGTEALQNGQGEQGGKPDLKQNAQKAGGDALGQMFGLLQNEAQETNQLTATAEKLIESMQKGAEETTNDIEGSPAKATAKANNETALS